MRSPRWLPLTLCVALFLVSPAASSATSAPVWLPAASGAGASSSDVQVAYDTAGNATAVWRKTASGADSVWAASKPQGSTDFSAVKRLSAVPAAGETPQVADLTLAVDAQGGAVAAWTSRYTAGADPYVYLARRSGGSWEAPQPFADGGVSTSPTVGFAGTGNALLAWCQATSEYTQVRVSSIDVASGDVAALQAIAPTANAAQPRLAFDPGGNGVLSWVETAVSFSAPYTGAVSLKAASRKVSAATFTAPKLVYETRTATIDDPAVAFDASGNATIAWANRLLGTTIADGVYAATRAAGTTSWPGAPLSLTGVEPELASSPAGGAVVTWVEPALGAPADTGAVMAAHREPGIANFAPGVLLSSVGEVGAAPTVAAGAAGTTVVAWTRRQGSGDAARAAVKAPASNTFWPAEDLEAAGGSLGAVAVAVNGLHDAVALWQPAGGPSTLQRIARLDGATVSAAPTPVDPAPTTPADPGPTTPAGPNPTTPADPNPTTPADPNPTTPTSPAPTTPTGPNPTTPAVPSNPAPTTPPAPSTPSAPSTPAAPTRAPVVSVAKDPAAASKETAQSAAGTTDTDLQLSIVPSLRSLKALGTKRFKAASRGDGLLPRGDGLPLAATGNLPGTLRVVVTSTPKGGKAKNLKPAMTLPVVDGTTKFVFTGRLAGKPLPAGLYKLKAVFVDERGRASNRRELNIAIKR